MANTGEIINRTIAPLRTEITLYNDRWIKETKDFTQLINYNSSVNTFLKGNFGYPYNSTDFCILNFAIPNSLEYFGYYFLRMDITFDSTLSNHSTIKYSIDPIIVDFTVNYNVILEEFRLIDNNIDSQTFSVGEVFDGDFKILIKHHYLNLEERYPENNIDSLIDFIDDEIVLKLLFKKLSDNTTFTIDINMVKHGEYTFSRIISLNSDNTGYKLALEYKSKNWEEDEYNSVIIVEDTDIIGEFSHEFEIVTKLVARIENNSMELGLGTDIIFEIFIDGETEIKYEKELDLEIWDDYDNKLSYTYNSEDNKYTIWKNHHYEVGSHWLRIEINEEDLDCKLYRRQLIPDFIIYQNLPADSSTNEENGNDIDIEESAKIILFLGIIIGISVLPIYIILYNIRIKLKK